MLKASTTSHATTTTTTPITTRTESSKKADLPAESGASEAKVMTEAKAAAAKALEAPEGEVEARWQLHQTQVPLQNLQGPR